MEIRRILTAMTATLGLAACTPMESFAPPMSQISPQLGLGEMNPLGPGNGSAGPAPTTPAPALKICSDLDFVGTSWPVAVQITHQDFFALALNISGSFEGHLGWANLTNNFDGQGVSMGLLNQNLGQGSLQPLWISMRDGHLTTLQKILTASQLKSMSDMLNKWTASATSGVIDIYEYGYSDLDDPERVAEDLGVDPLELEQIETALLARNQTAVNWAKATLYSGSSFKSEWSVGLKAMANSAGYRTLQIAKAEKLHLSALALMSTLKFKSRRAYLFFFDIMVQNGSIPESIRNQLRAWEKSNPSATETQRLIRLLEYRLKIVKPEFVTDVRARKMSLINGKGTVHGSPRDYAKQYCTNLDGNL